MPLHRFIFVLAFPFFFIALESGVIENDSALLKWNGQPRRMKIWEKGMIFREAFHRSCVPCYQEIARKVGAKKINLYLKKLNYQGMKVDSANIDVFWLEGESGISQYQQIDFLNVTNKLNPQYFFCSLSGTGGLRSKQK